MMVTVKVLFLQKVECDVVIEGEGNVVNNGVDDVLKDRECNVLNDGNEANDDGHMVMPKMRKRNPSERISKLKHKKTMFDKDVGGSTCSYLVILK